jgi:hypothetical protein
LLCRAELAKALGAQAVQQVTNYLSTAKPEDLTKDALADKLGDLLPDNIDINAKDLLDKVGLDTAPDAAPKAAPTPKGILTVTNGMLHQRYLQRSTTVMPACSFRPFRSWWSRFQLCARSDCVQ